jgi:hypothetical protein
MWFLYSVSGLFASSFFLNKVYELYNKFYPIKYKTFEDVPVKDVYNIVCYRIRLEDNSEIVKSELGLEDIEDIEENNKINYITIEYMFNGQFMKYITRKQDIRFPIYNFKIEPAKFLYYPESIFLNEVNITNWVTPYLGPLCNFYRDREEPIELKDVLADHPNFQEFNFEDKDGVLIMISNDTPINGKKCIIRKLPCSLIWKRHAAVDPKDDYKLI